MTEVISARELKGDLTLDADLCVVGTGAGGAMVARQAALAGLRVVALEEGPRLRPELFTQREDEMIPLLFQQAGARATVDGAITVLQGRGLGGSTVHNTNLCKRAPDEILRTWPDGWRAPDLLPHYEAVERELNVRPIEPHLINRNNALLQKGAEKLGWRGAVLSHNRDGCIGSGFCELGCPVDGKQNALKVLLPAAQRAGARIVADCHAEQILMQGRRAVGVLARGAAVTVEVRAPVCLSGSAIGSPLLALRSAIADENNQIGRGLHLHPGAAVAGIFDDRVEGWIGIPQSYECTEQLRFDEDSDARVWIVPGFAHPAGAASLLPGFGAEHRQRMRDYAKMAILVAVLHDRSSGTVKAASDGRPLIHYALDDADQRALNQGLHACVKLLFAAGARRVLVPFASPLELDRVPSDFNHVYRPLDPLLTAVHPMGTLALGRVCDEEARLRGVENLWVADGSLFPSSIGGPPQMTIYAAARKVAAHIVATLGRR